MNKDRVQIPEDIIVLKIEHNGEEELATELSLSAIPESEAGQLQDGVDFVNKSNLEGFPNATADYGYYADKFHFKFVSYRVCRKGSSGARNFHSD